MNDIVVTVSVQSVITSVSKHQLELVYVV